METPEGTDQTDSSDNSSGSEENDAPIISPEVIGDTTELHSETSKEETGAPDNAREQYKGVKGTGVFTTPDPLDPAMRKRVDAQEQNMFDFVEFNGKCAKCGRMMNDGRPEAKCTTCGEIMHQFCFDAHVLEKHKPPAVAARIVIKDGEYFAKIRKVPEK